MKCFLAVIIALVTLTIVSTAQAQTGKQQCYIINNSRDKIFAIESKIIKDSGAYEFGYGNVTTTEESYASTIYYYKNMGYIYAVFHNGKLVGGKNQQEESSYTVHYFNTNTLHGIELQTSQTSLKPIQEPAAATFAFVDCKTRETLNAENKMQLTKPTEAAFPKEFCYRVNDMGSSNVHMKLFAELKVVDEPKTFGLYIVANETAIKPHFVLVNPTTEDYTLFSPAQEYGGVIVWQPSTKPDTTGYGYSWFNRFNDPHPRYYIIQTAVMWNCDKKTQ